MVLDVPKAAPHHHNSLFVRSQHSKSTETHHSLRYKRNCFLKYPTITAIMDTIRGAVVEQPITDTLETNYMPYAMSVIVSRAIPEIDGFKPSHRKLLYTMYKMGLLTGARTKSANIVGQTMRLNPHGDAAIYDTMVRLSKGYGALLTPLWTPKGNFGKSYFPGYVLGRPPVYGGKALRHLRRALPGHRQRHRGLCGQLRQHHEGAGPAAHHLPQHSGVRQQRHRRGHGLPVLRL